MDCFKSLFHIVAAWSGSTQNWLYVSHVLPSFIISAQRVQIRFMFASDESLTDDGIAIDDFALRPGQ